MSVPCVPLAEVCEINPATDYKFAADEPCTFVPMEAMDDVSARITSASTRPFRELQKGYTVFAEDDVLIAKITPCMENGKCAIARRLRNRIGFGSTEFHVLRASKHALPQWLFYFWRLPATRSLAERNMTGSAGQKRVSTNFLETLKIPLPPLSEQQRIVELLEQADRLRRTRRYAFGLSNTLLPAAFLELFGDPVLNQREWPKVPLKSVVQKITDGEHLNPKFVNDGLPIVMAEQVEEAGVNLSSCKKISNDDFQRFTRKCKPEPNDILIVSRGATIGRSCVVNVLKPFCLMGSVILIKPDKEKVNPDFLTVQFKSQSFQNLFKVTSGASAQQAIYLAHLKERNVVVPPMKLQQYFASLVSRHQRMRAGHREAVRQSEHFFQSLLHRSFTAGI